MLSASACTASRMFGFGAAGVAGCNPPHYNWDMSIRQGLATSCERLQAIGLRAVARDV